jgi:hypothetical protein
MIIEPLVAVAGLAKGVAVVHAAIISRPRAGHARTGVAFGKGTVAAAKGIAKTAISTETTRLAKRSERAQTKIEVVHGLDGHISSNIPGTFEHVAGLDNTDVVKMPRRIVEIGQFAHAVGFKKAYCY